MHCFAMKMGKAEAKLNANFVKPLLQPLNSLVLESDVAATEDDINDSGTISPLILVET